VSATARVPGADRRRYLEQAVADAGCRRNVTLTLETDKMRKLVPLAAVAALAFASGTASAQVLTDDYTYESDAPQVYRYVPDPAMRAPRVDAWGNVYDASRPFGRNGCGTYRFWNGERCVDARYR
jgi:hypothetical protein